MRQPNWSVERLKSEIELLGARGLSRSDYFAELGPRLRRAVPSDATCWHTLDPQTRLLTSDEPRELVEQGIYTPDTVAAAGEVLVRSEYMSEDPNTFAKLAGRRVPVGILDAGDARQAGAKRALSRPARALRDPARAAGGVRQARAGLGSGPRRPTRVERGLHAARRRRPGAGDHGDRRGDPRLAALRRRPPGRGRRSAGARRHRRRRRGRADHAAGLTDAGRDRDRWLGAREGRAAFRDPGARRVRSRPERSGGRRWQRRHGSGPRWSGHASLLEAGPDGGPGRDRDRSRQRARVRRPCDSRPTERRRASERLRP